VLALRTWLLPERQGHATVRFYRFENQPAINLWVAETSQDLLILLEVDVRPPRLDSATTELASLYGLIHSGPTRGHVEDGMIKIMTRDSRWLVMSLTIRWPPRRD